MARPVALRTEPAWASHVLRLFSFNGRARRSHYWICSLGVVALDGIILMILDPISGDLDATRTAGRLNLTVAVIDVFLMLVGLAAALVGAWLSLAVGVRRWHDRGRSGLWSLLGLVPVIGWVWQLFECGVLEGTRGPNPFGPSPKGVSPGLFARLDASEGGRLEDYSAAAGRPSASRQGPAFHLG